jgi:hypothetical protein
MFMPRAAVVALFLALSVVSLSAQRRGGFAMHGPSVAFRAPHAGFSAAPHISGRRVGGPRFVTQRPFDFDDHFRPHRIFYGYTGIYAYPNYGYPYYDTLHYPSNDYSADQRSYNQTEQLSRQVYDLSSEVRDLRDKNEQLRYDLDRQRSAEAQAHPLTKLQSLQANPAKAEAPLTVLVFQDGHRVDIRNYAIVGQTLWILSRERAQKVSFAQLNLGETKKVNAEKEVEFDLPSKN